MPNQPATPQFSDIHEDRVKRLNEKEINQDANYVLYWMQHGQRTEWNHALEYAIRWAKELDKSVVVGFGLMEDYPDGNWRHFTFMLEGLLEVKKSLADRNMAFVIRMGKPSKVAIELAEGAAAVVCDRGYLRHHRQWRKEVAGGVDIACVQVESELVVPIEVASDKQEYAARTIRKKLMNTYKDYLERPDHMTPPISSLNYGIGGINFTSVDAVLKKMDIDRTVEPSEEFKGSTRESLKKWKTFRQEHLTKYDEYRNQPHTEHLSFQSPYLHLGQISPCHLIDDIQSSRSNENKEAYIEELLVRRELTHNFVYYCKDYDSFSCLPDWAAQTLDEHKDDDRPHVYTRDELEKGETDDEYWNAAMQQMRERGYLHNHMRMYWGKQILKWTNTPKYAYETALYLNNKYFLDGRDANSYANIAWLFGLHDRAWQERDIYGKVRIMTPGGLERKTDPEKFVEKVKS